jgi:hypothetical protein
MRSANHIVPGDMLVNVRLGEIGMLTHDMPWSMALVIAIKERKITWSSWSGTKTEIIKDVAVLTNLNAVQTHTHKRIRALCMVMT